MTQSTLLATARDLGESLSGVLRSVGAKRTMLAGDARRGVAMVDELVLLTCGVAPRKVADALDAASASVGVKARLKVAGAERRCSAPITVANTP